MLMLISYMVFAGLLGFVLFNSEIYADEEGYFDEIPMTIFNIYVLFTTSNFPDIMFPYWKLHNWAAFYFVGFLLLGLYMGLNLMLAVFYNSFRHQVEKKINKYDKIREEFLSKEFLLTCYYPNVKDVDDSLDLKEIKEMKCELGQFQEKFRENLTRSRHSREVLRDIEK